MNSFQRLLQLSSSEKEEKGVMYTPAEIAQQPEVWKKTVELVLSRKDEIRSFMEASGMSGATAATIILTGAGSSEFVGNALEVSLRQLLHREVISIPTTSLLTHARDYFVSGHRYVLISFARSGNSPESLAVYDAAKKIVPALKQVVITCNAKGALAEAARKDRDALSVELPPESDDKSLVMTSSFTGMAAAALCLGLLDDPEKARTVAARAGSALQRIIEADAEPLYRIGSGQFTRAAFLGSGALLGTMQECHLKLQEMTDGEVACRFDSFLGVRHGPKVFIKRDCLTVAALSSDRWVRQYELDLLKELKAAQQGCATIVICDRETPEIRAAASHVIELFPEGGPIDDRFRILTDAVVGQIIGLFKSLSLGFKPDAPSASGTISRVVKGVTIYPMRL